MSSEFDAQQSESGDLQSRLESLERENERLKRRMNELIGPDNPGFDAIVFQRTLQRVLLLLMIPIFLIAPLSLLPQLKVVSIPRIDLAPGFPLIDPGGLYSGRPGLGFGFISIGGLAVGVVAFGGAAVGLVAIGGGALGVLAFGGGAVGVIAVGGGAVGYVAIGGGGFGRYVLAGDGRGRAVLSRRRQDPEAVELFTRWFPALKKAFTGPMPVVPVDKSGWE
ncbi:MAG: bZIP transcription factor [Phycisphaerae bacterium]|nr:bZIP transcription factor [Phycisphaerae bacterium]NUQ44606.1 bZIP transcription factor [Phycisphaerae bacterium]